MPGSRPALAGLARAHYRGRQLEALAAVLLKQAAVRTEPGQRQRAGGRGRPLYAFRLGRVDDALAATARALSLDPSNVAAIAEHARLLGRLGRGAEQADALGNLGQALADPTTRRPRTGCRPRRCEWQLGAKARGAGRD